MALKQAAVTVTDASGTQDLIVPLGTTVTGLLSMLDIDSTDPSLQITGADGRALDMGAPKASLFPSLPAASARSKNSALSREPPTPGSARP